MMIVWIVLAGFVGLALLVTQLGLSGVAAVLVGFGLAAFLLLFLAGWIAQQSAHSVPGRRTDVRSHASDRTIAARVPINPFAL